MCICYLRHTASYRSMGIGPHEIYNRVMSIVEHNEPTIKTEVSGLFGKSYQKQEFDTKFTELWKSNWESTRNEVRADIIVFINNETAWAEEENKKWGDDCRKQALKNCQKYISEKARTNSDKLKTEIIADFQNLANKRENAYLPRKQQENSYQAEIKNRYIV